MTVAQPADDVTPESASRRLERLIFRLVAAAALALAIGGVLDLTQALGRADRLVTDRLMRLRGTARLPTEIATVALSRSATRAEHADAITSIHRAGAKVIAYDVAFEYRRSRREDDRLLRALRGAQPVVLGALVADKNTAGYGVPRLFRHARELNAAGVRVGLSAYPRDPDGKIRRVALAPLRRDDAGRQAVPREFDPRDMPGFPYAVALTVGGGTLKEGVATDNQDIIDFHGPPGTFKPIPFEDVIDGLAPVDAFRDRVVVVGTTRRFSPTGAGAVPTADVMDNVEIDANAITTLLDGAPLRQPGPWTRLLVLIAAAFTPLAIIAAGPWSRVKRSLVVPATAIAIVTGAWPRFDDLIYWPWTYAATALIISSLATWFVVTGNDTRALVVCSRLRRRARAKPAA